MFVILISHTEFVDVFTIYGETEISMATSSGSVVTLIDRKLNIDFERRPCCLTLHKKVAQLSNIELSVTWRSLRYQLRSSYNCCIVEN